MKFFGLVCEVWAGWKAYWRTRTENRARAEAARKIMAEKARLQREQDAARRRHRKSDPINLKIRSLTHEHLRLGVKK